MECSETDPDRLHYLARGGGHVKDSCRGRVGADDAVCEDEGGPGYLMHKAGIAVTGYCGCWLEMIHLGRWTRYGADKEAALDLWVHTVNTDTKTRSEGDI